MDLFDSMKNKNILIQDVGRESELQRFIGHNIYRRSEPLPNTVDHVDFFAPYFTSAAQEKMGLNGIYCVDMVSAFAAKRETLQKVFGNLSVFKWESGLNVLNDNYEGVATYYFLGESIVLKNPIVKETPPASPLKLNSTLSWNLIKSMQDFCEAAQQAQ